jgi:dTMP kinase
MSNNRTFVVLDGPDFSGKSFLMEAFVKRVEAEGIEHVAMREPGCQPGVGSVAEEIRELLLATRDEVVNPETDIMMHMAYRNQNVKNVILPALAQNKWVISDRFVFSTWCLNVQAHLDTHPHLAEIFNGLMPYVLNGLPEPITFILDTPREIRDERAKSNVRKLDRYESQGKEVHDRIEAAYNQLRAAPSCIFLDGTKPTEELVEHMLAAIKAFDENLTAQIEAQKARGDVQGEEVDFAEQQAQKLRTELDEDAEWDLEVKIAEYVKTYITDIAEQLFPGAKDDDLIRLTKDAEDFAYKTAKAAFTISGEDRTLFHPARVGQVNQKVHTVLNAGFMREQWEKHFATNNITVPVAVEPETSTAEA